jgi:hypothetical protein
MPMDQPAISCSKFVFPSNGEPEKKQKYFGIFLASLPTEILIPFFKRSNSATKNGLRLTNTFFSVLFSWVKVHPFALCKELNVHDNDIQSLIIQYMHKTNKSDDESKFIKNYEKRFFSYQILGQPHFLALEFVGDDNEKKPDLYLFDNIIRKKQSVHPFLEACLTRNATIVETYLNSTSPQTFNMKNGLSIHTFCHALQVLVQNDDTPSLEMILNNQKINKSYIKIAFYASSSKLLQAAVVCASPKIIPYILPSYQTKNLSGFLGGEYKEKDWIGQMLVIDPAKTDLKRKKDFLGNILTVYHLKLLERHQPDPSNYHLVLRTLLNEKGFNTLLNQNDIQNSDKSSHNKCLLM